MSISKLFSETLKVVNVGSPSFKKDFETQGLDYVHLE